MKVKNYDEAREALYPYLQNYLEDSGIDLSKPHFTCINPDHNDHSPSMSIFPDGKTIHCFGCNISGGIFHAAQWLENRSITFNGFLDTLSYLADKYGVDLEYDEPSEEEAYRYNIYAAYRAASSLIVGGEHSVSFDKAIAERGWGEQTIRNLGIGSVRNHEGFRAKLESLGFDARFIDEIDLGRSDIFGDNRLIFTIQDDHGKPVGFAARNLLFTKDKSNGPKYINLKSSGTQYDIYRKSERLYGLFQYLEKAHSKPRPLYIFEGYADVATAHEHGVWNSCAIGGTALTHEHVNLLKKLHLYNLVLCLDGDTAGQKETARLLDEVLGGHRELNVKVVIMPPGTDPDSFIRDRGVEEFHKLKKWSAFEWRLAQFPENADSEEVANKMIALIMNETSHIAQEKMAKILAKATGFTERALTSELDRLQNIKQRKKIQDKQTIAEKLKYNIDRDVTDLSFYLREAEDALTELDQRYEADVFSEEAMVVSIRAHVEEEESKTESDTGFRLGSDLLSLEEKLLSADWKKDVWICLAGKPNAGKTSFLSKVAYSIASNDSNNACVLYHTIDDTKKQVLPKYAAIADGSRRLMIDDITHPTREDLVNKDTKILRKTSYDRVTELAAEGKLIIQDANDGFSLAFADSWIRAYRKKYPDRNIIYILDNFHKLQDMSGSKDERVRFKELSKKIKEMATKHHICIITTVEYKKVDAGKEATNSDIGETGQIEYDANLILHLHNDMHERDDNTPYVHYHNFGKGKERLPRIQIKITKNKINGYKGRLWFDFFPACSDFAWVKDNIVYDEAKSERDQKKQGTAEEKAIWDKAVQDMEAHPAWKEAKFWHLVREGLGFEFPCPEDEKTIVNNIIKKFGTFER